MVGWNNYMARNMREMIWRYLRPPMGRPARRMVGGLCLIVGLSRIGLLSFAASTAVPAPVYGWLLIVLAAMLWATAYSRLSIMGRIVSVFGFAILTALAVDVFISASFGSEISGMILAYLAYIMLGETVSNRVDC